MEHVAAFLQYLEYERRYSPHTVNAYRRDLNMFSRFLSDSGIGSLYVDFRVIRRWVVDLVQQNESTRTVNRKIAALRAYFKYLKKKELITVDPTEKVGTLKIDKKLPLFVTTDKMDDLLDEKSVDSEDFKDMRDKMIIELFYMTGIRLSELINLKINDLDLSAMTLKVLGKRNKERIIPLTALFCERLSQYVFIKKEKFPLTDFLFVTDSGKPLYARWVQRLTDEKLGMVTTQKKRSPHVLRHSFATNILLEGAELNAIKEILGHSNLAATQLYTHNSLKRLKKVYEQAHPRA